MEADENIPAAASAEAIARRAYELFAERGYGHGHDVEDWLQAEAEVARPSRARRAGEIRTAAERAVGDLIGDPGEEGETADECRPAF